MNTISQSIEQLEALKKELHISKKERGSDWEDYVSKLVGLISNDFALQKNPKVALNQISLITLAATLGNKGAKKKVLKPNLWLKDKPPSIVEEISNIQQKKSAIKSLSSIKSEWVAPYILNELKINQEDNLHLDYLDWLLKQSQTAAQLLRYINEAKLQPQKFSKEEWFLELISYLTVQLTKRKIHINEDSIVEISMLLSECNLTKDMHESMQARVFDLLNIASNIEPSILLKSKTVALISFFKYGHETKNKKLIELQNSIKEKIFDLLNFLSTTDKSETETLISLLNESLSKSTKGFKDFKLDKTQKISVEDLSNSYEIDNLIVTIISNWNDYLSNVTKNSATEQLSIRLDDLLKKFSISPIGLANSNQPYDPLMHELVKKNENHVLQVKIIKIGYGKLRSDGSVRVLLKALVSDKL